jgi:hypothetical protein
LYSLIRLDGTLKGFKSFQWERGNISFLFRGVENLNDCFLILDHDDKQIVHALQQFEHERHRDPAVESLLRGKVFRVNFDTTEVSFRPSKSWLGYEKTEQIGDFKTTQCEVSGIKYVHTSRKDSRRQEHEVRAPALETDVSFTSESYFHSDNPDGLV